MNRPMKTLQNQLPASSNRLIRFLPVWLAALATVLVAGCASTEKQVQNVAKDWCMTIRGSQVIPVYPLTEDIQPGDVFLVQVPVDRQQEIYKQKGFLPMDNHLARLNPAGFGNFYSHSFLGGTNQTVLPRDWIRPNGVGSYLGTNGSNTHAWLAAPRAAFPSYSFSVRNGAGLSLAVPVSGVPVGLSLLASDAASGSIQIQDARTLGVDTLSLYAEVRAWAATNVAFLRSFGAGTAEKKTNFLRIVTRVYATGRMVVNLKDASNRSGGLDVGVPKPVDLLQPELPSSHASTPEAAMRNYTNSWNAMSAMVAAASAAKDAAGNILPGGSLRLAAASARSVSLDETFDPPLIVGYLGFDCAIFRGGILGPPIPTHAVLDASFDIARFHQISPVYGKMLDVAIYEIVSKDVGNPKAGGIRAKLDALEAYVPNEFTEYGSETTNSLVATALTADKLHAGGKPTYRNYIRFHSRLEHSISALELALSQPMFQLTKGEAQPVAVPVGSPLRRELEQALVYYRNLHQNLAEEPKIQDAISDVHGYYFENLAN